MGTPPVRRRFSVCSNSRPPRSANSARSDPAVSAGPMASTRCMIMGPASSAATMRMMVTPVSVSPAASDRSMGAAPRQAGSSDAWTFMGMSRGTSSTAWGRIMP
ncbi:hypothetical protein DSECCO2_482560 [anaerobic digester metagenome]